MGQIRLNNIVGPVYRYDGDSRTPYLEKTLFYENPRLRETQNEWKVSLTKTNINLKGKVS